jgi:serpin B
MKNTTMNLCSLLLALLAGCSSITDAGRVPMRSLTKEEERVVDASSGFGLNLFREINRTEKGKNLFISPLSVSMALGMTMNGASGATLDSMRRTLDVAGMTEAEINASYRSLIDLLTRVDPGVKFQIANSIWSRQGFAVEQPFIDTNRHYFDAEIASLDFSSADASKTINGWVSQKTNGKIEKIVPDQIDRDMVMYLINAIYFKGSWRSRFDPKETADAPFTVVNGSTKQVPMMHNHAAYAYYGDQDLQAIDLPYGDSLFSMTVLLPNPSVDIDTFAGTLTEENLNRWIGSLKPGGDAIDLYLPKFRLEYEKTLNDMLKEMGMGIAFSGAADFTRIERSGGLAISEVKHKTFVEVNEEGTEAAAATSVGIIRTSLPPQMRVDRPFIFLIRERTSGAILFIGKITDPSA